MKSILTKIEFHYTYIIIALGFVLTGYFYNLLAFTTIILVHELGHIFMFFMYKVEIKKIIIYPYGGNIKISSKVNRDINEDLLIAIMGIVFQTFFYSIIVILFKSNIISHNIFNLYTMYHYSILIFNLLPLYPLDGFKILNLLLSKILPFKLSLYITISISFICIILLLFFKLNYSYIMIISLFINNTYIYFKNVKYIYNKFILERYLYEFNYKKKVIINNINKMYKNKKHIFKLGKTLYSEKSYLNKRMLKK